MTEMAGKRQSKTRDKTVADVRPSKDKQVDKDVGACLTAWMLQIILSDFPMLHDAFYIFTRPCARFRLILREMQQAISKPQIHGIARWCRDNSCSNIHRLSVCSHLTANFQKKKKRRRKRRKKVFQLWGDFSVPYLRPVYGRFTSYKRLSHVWLWFRNFLGECMALPEHTSRQPDSAFASIFFFKLIYFLWFISFFVSSPAQRHAVYLLTL